MSFSIENILDKVIFCTRLYPGYPGNMPIKNPKPGGLNTRLIGHLTKVCLLVLKLQHIFQKAQITSNKICYY